MCGGLDVVAELVHQGQLVRAVDGHPDTALVIIQINVKKFIFNYVGKYGR